MRKLVMAALFAVPMFVATAMAQDTLKIGYIDPSAVAVPALAKEA
jgi:hypothetical protein